MSLMIPNGPQPEVAGQKSGLFLQVQACPQAPLSRARCSEFRLHNKIICLSRELRRYFVAGCLAFACDASTLYILTEFVRVNYLISAMAGFGFGLAVSYLTNRFWVFERRTLTSTAAETAVFSAIALSGLGMNEGILWAFQAKLGISYLIAKIFSGGAVAVWTFALRKLMLFH